MKPWYTSKTLWINMAAAVCAAIEANTKMLQPHLPFDFFYALTVFMPAVNAGLRFISTKELTK